MVKFNEKCGHNPISCLTVYIVLLLGIFVVCYTGYFHLDKKVDDIRNFLMQHGAPQIAKGIKV